MLLSIKLALNTLKKGRKYMKKLIFENHEKVDLLNDFWNMHQILREDYYVLNGIKNIFNRFISIDSKEKCESNNKKMDIYVEEINSLINLYHNLEDIINKKYDLEDEAAIDTYGKQPSSLNEIEYFYKLVEKCIKLSATFQEKNYDMLMFILNTRITLNLNYSEASDEAKEYYAFSSDKSNVCRNLDISKENDKIINYEIVYTDNDKKMLKDFKSLLEKYGDPEFVNNKKIFIGKRDRRYSIKKLIELIELEYNSTIKIHQINESKSKENNLTTLNKNIFILNFIASIIGIISVLPILKDIYQVYGVEPLLVLCILIAVIIVIFYRQIFCKDK